MTTVTTTPSTGTTASRPLPRPRRRGRLLPTIVLLIGAGYCLNNFLLPFIMLSDDAKFPLTTGLYLMLNQGTGQPALYSLAIMGALLSIIPLVALMLFLQRYWKLDLISGSLKG